MEERIEIPPGLVRTWKALVWVALTCIVFGSAGWGTGRSYAREVIVEKRVEVPTPACRDEMIQVEDNEDRKHISCVHPEHHGEFKNVSFDRYRQGPVNVPYLVCTCPHAQLEMPEAGAK